MQTITTLSFAQLRNAEHVSFLTNVKVAIEKVGAESLGFTQAQVKAFADAIALEQDIVNRSMASVYTPEMKALDEERDRLFKVIRYKLQAAALAGSDSELAEHSGTIQTNILTKYGLDIATKAYQEESALLRGFVLDLNTRFTASVLKKMDIDEELASLDSTNEQFTSQYNERVTEKSGTENEYSQKLRAASEEQYGHVKLHLEFKANSEPATDAGMACVSMVGIVNQLIKDVKHNLALRLGKETLQTSL